MFSSEPIMKFTKGFSDELKLLKEKINSSDCIIIGAGAGLSSSAGFAYSGERFERNFSDFKKKYGFSDMYTGGFYPYNSKEELWAYWSRYIYINRYCEPPKDTYKKLFSLVASRDYFVITTNVDHCFQKAGFDKKRLFYTQGDYGLFQCCEPCHNKTYDNKDIIEKMVLEQKNMRVASQLLPKCPVCGKPMTMNLRSDERFVEDEGWQTAAQRYSDFLRTRENQNILFLELGVGANTPVIIKYPFWEMTAKNKNAVYACINFGEAFCPDEIKSRSICINGDIDSVLSALCEK